MSAAAFDAGRRVADAVLYEGYVLYPYRASSEKNRVRWQFGALAPRRWSEAGGCERWWSQSELIVEGDPGLALEGRLRFLQPRPRRIELLRGGVWERVDSVELEGELHTSFEEAIEREVALRWSPAEGPAERRFAFGEPGTREGLAGDRARRVHEAVRLQGCVQLSCSGAGDGWLRLRIRVENRTPWARVDAPRAEALAGAMAGVHWLLRAEGGRFASLTDPPESLREEAGRCENVGTWPVLLGALGDGGDPQRSELLLSSPIILPDRPEVSPESDGDFFDATEIDEMLSLRVHTLTPAEQREALATDPRAAEVVARCADLPAEALERMHGALRTWRELGGEAPPGAPAAPALPSEWERLFDGPHPEEDSLELEGAVLRKGSRVRLRPSHRADAQDLFLEGRIARIEGVFRDVDGRSWLGVVPESDESEDLFRWHGRFFYFHPDEVEPIQEGEA